MENEMEMEQQVEETEIAEVTDEEEVSEEEKRENNFPEIAGIGAIAVAAIGGTVILTKKVIWPGIKKGIHWLDGKLNSGDKVEILSEEEAEAELEKCNKVDNDSADSNEEE